MQTMFGSVVRVAVRASVFSAIVALGVLPTTGMAQSMSLGSGSMTIGDACGGGKSGGLSFGFGGGGETKKKLDEDSLLVLQDFATKEKPVIKIDTTISTLAQFEKIPLAEVASVNFTTYARLEELQDAETVKKKYGKQITKGLLTIVTKPDPCKKKEEAKKE